MKLLAKHEADKQIAAEEKAAKQAKKDAENVESAKIAVMLKKWEEQRLERGDAENAAIVAAKDEMEEKVAKEADPASLNLAAKGASNAKTRAVADEAEKARKYAEEAAAKAPLLSEDEKASIHFHDAEGGRHDLPWKLAKTFKVSLASRSDNDSPC